MDFLEATFLVGALAEAAFLVGALAEAAFLVGALAEAAFLVGALADSTRVAGRPWLTGVTERICAPELVVCLKIVES
ncbi:hypothetical protein CREGCYN_13580 [Synechococcus sp. M16CYN]